jgi:hypothetical protein
MKSRTRSRQRKRQASPTYTQAIAALDALIASEAEAETAFYRAGGCGTQYLDRREALEDARRLLKQLKYGGNAE